MIRRKSDRVEKVIQALELLPKIPPPNGDLTHTELLTPSEISRVLDHFKRENPGLVAHIRRAREPFPDDWKFDLRQAFLGLVVTIVTSSQKSPTKLHHL